MLGISLDINDYLSYLIDKLHKLDLDNIRLMSDLIYKTWQSDNTIYIIGNGGSATTATHMSEDLAKSTIPDDKLLNYYGSRLKVISLTDNIGWITAVANDLDYDYIFVQQLQTLARSGDLLMAISGSGNSRNIIEAVNYANIFNIQTFGLTGFDGGELKKIQKNGIHVDCNDMGMVESIHLCLFHWVLNDVHARINRVGRYENKNNN